MTTIDSDSESQDSDDGRRFRFEATRKDDTLRLQSHNRRRSPLSKASKYGPRSGDRSYHNRRDYDRTKQDRDRKEGTDREKRKGSKERESRDNNKYDGNKSNSKESRYVAKGNVKDGAKETPAESEKCCGDSKNSKDSLRNSSNSKDYKNSKDSRSRESKNSSTRAVKDTKIRESKDPRDQDSKVLRDRETKTSGRDSENKDSRDRDRGLKRPRESSHDRLSAAKHGHRSREKYDKSRDRSNNREKGKQPENEKSKEERSKNLLHKKNPRKESEPRKSVKREAHSPSKILDQIGSDSESDLGALDPDVGPVMALDTFEDCREMNLSDFDIISDTEGSSPDTREDKPPSKRGIKVKGEILAPHYYGPKITKRVSRRQYERLVRRQAALNTRRLEEFYKVNGRNDDITRPDPSCNNPSAVSDFLLGPEASVKAVEERRGSRKIDQENSDDSGDDQESEDNEKFQDQDLYARKLHHLEIEKLSLGNEKDGKSELRSNKLSPTGVNHRDEFLDTEIYGPSLPPKCQKYYSVHRDDQDNTVIKKLNKDGGVVASSRLKTRHRRTSEKPSSSTESDKTLPTESCLAAETSSDSRPLIIGPSLPPEIRLNSASPKSKPEDSEENCSPGSPSEEPTPIIGPSLPPHLRQETSNSVMPKDQDSTVVSSQRSIFGPTLPPNFVPKVQNSDKSDSDSEDGVLGPMPADHPAAMGDYIQRQLEDRAKRMKNKLDGKNLVNEKREEWMLELPSAQAANLGLGKRQFRAKAGPDMSDRSSWTDTPADKAKKREDKLLGKAKIADPARESERLAIHQRDKAMEKMAEKHASKKRKESLVEMHKKKLHKKKKKEEKEAKEAGKPARRPFDRDVDLQANKFDEAQKKSILKKAQLLNDRFSRGESKYL